VDMMFRLDLLSRVIVRHNTVHGKTRTAARGGTRARYVVPSRQ